MKNFKLAVCQNKPSRSKDNSVESVKKMISKAVNNKAELIVLPEIFHHPYELSKIPKIEDKNNEILDELKKTASDLSVYLCSGSIVTRDQNKRFNRSHLISPEGEVLLKHDKCHLYDVSFKNLRTKESGVFNFGNTVKAVDTELGKIGILLCYDIRFPEMAGKLAAQGVEIILAPAAFNMISGPKHWDIFFRCRAVENQVYLAAVSPARDSKSSYQAYGNSMIVDPMGKILTRAGVEEEIIYADISSEFLEETRNVLPLLKHKRPEIYG
ncbi:MAG: hypothetical protein K9M56_07635 [Victivallales bacterium]|nr:hypothetical protein [Victivallales bacterium]